MACKCAPSLLLLRGEVDQRWPGRDRSSDGCCGDAAHAARKSDHNADASGYAHALDIDEDLVAGMGDRQLWGLGITLLADKRTKYLIYEARILYPDGTDKPYTGTNAHRHHLHISTRAGTEHDARKWLPPHEEAELNADERRLLEQVNAKLDDFRAGRGFTDLSWLDKRLKQTEDRVVERVKAELDN